MKYMIHETEYGFELIDLNNQPNHGDAAAQEWLHHRWQNPIGAFAWSTKRGVWEADVIISGEQSPVRGRAFIRGCHLRRDLTSFGFSMSTIAYVMRNAMNKNVELPYFYKGGNS